MFMNRSQSEKFRDVHLRHEYNLIHMLPSTEMPALSGFYLKSFYNGAKRYRLQLPEFITEPDSKFCGTCGAVRVPSFNTEIAMVETGDDEGERIRALQYTCLHCSAQAKLAPRKIVPEREEKLPSDSPQVQRRDKIRKKSSAKERAKKRKKSTLSNMLSQKNEEKKSSAFSLSLESLMQND